MTVYVGILMFFQRVHLLPPVTNGNKSNQRGSTGVSFAPPKHEAMTSVFTKTCSRTTINWRTVAKAVLLFSAFHFPSLHIRNIVNIVINCSH